MAIVAQTQHGYILDHRKYSTFNVVAGKSSEAFQHLILKQSLFDINEPFRMDSQFEKIQASIATNEETASTRKRKKRKRVHPLNTGETLALDFHHKVSGYITTAYTELVALGKKSGYFHAQSTSAGCDNNVAARQTASLVSGVADFVEQCKQKPTHSNRVVITGDMEWPEDSIVNVVIVHEGSHGVMVKHQSGQYLIPPHCTFLQSDIQHLNMFTTDLGQYDLIVMDPPWVNKSVKRQKKYYTLDNDMILDIPLHKMMASRCLVIVWVTNKQKHIKFVTEQLFPRHGIKMLAQWYWLKVTTSGECVFDLNSPHKKPYETLIIGRYNQPCNHGNRNGGCDVKQSTCFDTSSCHSNGFPDNQVIVSVPCSLHSKKPPLGNVLKKYLPTDPRCLELFARNLLPNWTSWGNEVLYHQDHNLYEEVT